jgi:RNA polymerase sigma-70 factor (ECF subfamily)
VRYLSERGEAVDSNTIESAYRKYAGEAYLYSLSLCKDRHKAEDIVSEAFVKAMLSMSVNEKNFKLWLFRVCKTTWIDMCRRNCYVSDKSLDDISDIQSSDDILHNIIRQEEKKAVTSAILELPDLCREAITLYYYNNVPQAEIAEILGITHGATRTLLYRGRKILHEKLKEGHNEL